MDLQQIDQQGNLDNGMRIILPDGWGEEISAAMRREAQAAAGKFTAGKNAVICLCGDFRTGWPVKLMNLFFRLFLWIFSGIKIKDASNSILLCPAELLALLPPEQKFSRPGEILTGLKKQFPELNVESVYLSTAVTLPAVNPLTALFREVLALYRLACIRFSWLHHLFLYGIIGLAAAAVDYGIFALFTWLKWLSPELASIAGNIIGFLFTFSGNTFYNFKRSDHVIFRFISYFTIAAAGIALSTLIIHFSKESVNVYLVKALLILVVIPLIQFVLNKKITYRQFAE